MIHVWYCYLNDFDENYFEQYAKLLPISRLNEALKFFYFKDRMSRLMARLLIRKAIIDTHGRSDLINDWEFSVDKKPIIKTWMNFSISHSNDIVVVTFSECSKIGIDIEYTSSELEWKSIPDYFVEEERELINVSKNPKSRFFEIWTKKESILKGDGIGILKGLDKFNTSSSPVKFNDVDWYLKQIYINKDYECFLAYSNYDSDIKIKNISKVKLF